MEDYGPIAIVVVLTVIAFLVPAKYDPAIRLKERNERKRLEAERGRP